MKLRTVVLTVAGFGIPLALLVLALPITWGYGGYNMTDTYRVFFVDPTGPAARAGLSQGDRVVPMTGLGNVEQFGGVAGTTIRLGVYRRAGIVPISVTFEQFPGALGAQQRFNKILGALTALGAFIVAILVLFRARKAPVGARASAVLAAAGLDALAVRSGLVASNYVLATITYYLLPILFAGATFWAALSLLAFYPPHATRLRTITGRLGPWLFAAFILLAADRVYGIWFGGSGGFSLLGPTLILGASIILGAAIVDAIATAPPEYQAAMRWLGGCWLVADAVGAIGPAKLKTGFQSTWVGAAYFWFFASTLAAARGWDGSAWTPFAYFHGIVGSVTMIAAVFLSVYSLFLYLRRYGSLLGR